MFPKKHTLFGTATVNTKGQFVLPVAARKNAHINPGDQLLVVGIDDVLI
jgi:AbrB family looped-hinge helix DNA binding protein